MSYLPGRSCRTQQICVDKDLVTGKSGAFAAVVGLETSRKESFARFGEFQFQIMGQKKFVHLLLLLLLLLLCSLLSSRCQLEASMPLSQVATSWTFLSACLISKDLSCSEARSIVSFFFPVRAFFFEFCTCSFSLLSSSLYEASGSFCRCSSLCFLLASYAALCLTADRRLGVEIREAR